MAQVTLGDQARAAAARHCIPEPHVRLARAAAIGSYETPQWLEVVAQLPDGRRVQLSCELEHPERIARLRLA